MGVSWVWSWLVVKNEKGYIMALKQELDRIKKELADLNYRIIYGKTLTELI